MNLFIHQSFGSRFRQFLLDQGFSEILTRYLVDFSVLIIILAITTLIYYIVKIVINRILRTLIERSKGKWDDHLYEQKVFTRLAMLLPPVILHIALAPSISNYPEAIRILSIILKLYMIAIMILAGNSFLNAVYHIYSDYEVSSARPIKGYVQVGKIILYIIGGIVILSVLLGQSPITLLAGLGAMSAVLMLVFRDTILGFVAGIQLSSNKMMQIGDWITMPKFNADGTVLDISLVTVKIRNFDNSVSCIPTYSLISDSFQNWESMQEAGGRRLQRSILIDTGSVCFMDDPMLSRMRSEGLVTEGLVNKGEKITNLGLFRRYLLRYLQSHQGINQGATLMIRHLQSNESGLPLEIYAYYTGSELTSFEDFQSELFEYIFATLPVFMLNSFQRPTGKDILRSTQIREL